jgi:NAD(P)-dependent dehydrogenase (short-subunit alcohol dehydrogenase family)
VLEGKVSVVTGASKGIGLAVTRALVNEGAIVVGGAHTVGALADIPRVIGGGS